MTTSPQSLTVIQPAGGNLAEIDAYVNSVVSAGEQMASAGVQYLKFVKGEYQVGREGLTFPNNEFEAIPNFPEVRRGYQCWKDKQIVDEVWARLTEVLPPKANLPDHSPYRPNSNDGWQDSFRMELMVIPTLGVQERMRCIFTANSKGGINAAGALMKEYGKALKTGQYYNMFPVVRCSVDSYKHSSFGKVYVPVLKLDRWLTQQEAAVFLAGASQPVQQPTGRAAAGGQDQTVLPPQAQPAQRPKRTVNQSANLDDDIPFLVFA